MTNDKFPGENKTGTVLAGLFLLLIGMAAILRQTILDFPSWIMSWPMILILVGIFIGLKHGFRGPGWIILIGLGSIFLADKILPGVNLKPFIWPFVIIAIGIFMIVGAGKRKKWMREHWRWHADCGPKKNMNFGNTGAEYITPMEAETDQGAGARSKSDSNELVDVTSILGSAKKVIFSKNFQGGDITNFMGGTEINCTQADINGLAKLDITQIFGGTKLIVPAHWTIKSTATSIFAGFEDKRTITNIAPDPNKVLLIDGTSVFGGIEIKSY
ncbi:MAG: LiaF transmembrane domain-containing protein [Agriterribacter sp.]